MSQEEVPGGNESDPPAKGNGIFSRFTRLSGFTKGVITWLGAVASLVAALVGATYLIAPDLKPRDKLGATVDRIGIEQSVDYRSYEYKMNRNEPSSPRDEPSRRGIEVLVRASLYGFTDRGYSVRITLLESESLKAIYVTDEPFQSTCEILSPKANEDGVTWRCWATSPPPKTRYVVRAEIYDDGQYGKLNDAADGDVLLDFLDSSELTALASN
jgi:hypothetical protein